MFKPEQHEDIFHAAMRRLTSKPLQALDPSNESYSALTSVEPFDLISFPEAFLPSATLTNFFSQAPFLELPGCVHVGLRAGVSGTHLFSYDQAVTLTANLMQLSGTIAQDLSAFNSWLKTQLHSIKINIGCLFAVDASDELRICLHPKIVRSKFEVSSLPENDMHEGRLLTLVTLHPNNKRFRSITIQPVICSDILDIGTDDNSGFALRAVNRSIGGISDQPPDHIDVVSAVCCTPQMQQDEPKLTKVYSWHTEFKKTFTEAARIDDLSRHNSAVFVLSNFRSLDSKTVGGLSGTFVPTRLVVKDYEEFVSVVSWGRHKDGDAYAWSSEEGGAIEAVKWKNKGHIVALARLDDRAESTGRIFGFSIRNLPREMSPWGAGSDVVKCEQMIGKYQDPANLIFE